MSDVFLPESLLETLQKYQQAHLVSRWDQLSDESRHKLLKTLLSIDFSEVADLIDLAMHHSTDVNSTNRAKKISPLKQVVRLPETDQELENWKQAKKTGSSLLDSGKVGAILVAGGQGSRLGFPHPKGMYPIGPVTDRTLFQIFFEQLIALSNKHNVSIPYFMMTSDATHEETKTFLQTHNWFGYPPEDLFLFRQGKLPAIDDCSGKILLEDSDEIAMSPDGHGGMIQAIKKTGLLGQMQSRGIEYLYYHQVDNPTVRICDATMLGFHVLNKAEMSTKVVSKRSAEEKVGVVAEVEGVQQIIEYSDLDKELSELKDDSNRLTYWAGNIAVHIFNRSLLEKLTQPQNALPVHIAHKKVPFMNGQNEIDSPEKPNAYKFEQFIFDAIPKAVNPLVIEVNRKEEFNPVKNRAGEDTPESARAALNQQAASWLQQAGVKFQADAKIEISPLIALEAEDLKNCKLDDCQNMNEILINPDAELDE